MPKCFVCGESTQLFVMGRPTCLNCDTAIPDQRELSRKQRKEMHATVVAPAGIYAQEARIPTSTGS